MSKLGQALNELTDPPVKALVVYNSNPAADRARSERVLRGSARDDLFTVVLEQFQTDTADYADILLPVTTFLEHTDLYLAYGHYYLQLARPALARSGRIAVERRDLPRARRAHGIYGALFRRFRGRHDPRAARTPSIRFSRASRWSELDREHSVRLHVAPEGQPFLPFAEGGFGTPSRQVRVRRQVPRLSAAGRIAVRPAKPPLRAFPLELISSKNDDSMNSTFGNRAAEDAQTAILAMHTADAEPRSIATAIACASITIAAASSSRRM